MRVAAAVLVFAALFGSLNANIIRHTDLLQMPDSLDMTNASIVRVNPFDGPQVFDQFLVDVWRLGDFKMQPVMWNVSDWTGLGVPEEKQGGSQLGPSPSAIASTAVQYYSGSFGANLNTFSNPIQPNQSLATITIEYNWSPETRTSPWSATASFLELSLLYEVPSASRQGVAVYSSWSLGLLHKTTQKFVWFETALFDLDRPLGSDVIWLDTISGNAIVHGVLADERSLFHTVRAPTPNTYTILSVLI
jgi:hypothetical protein